MRSPFYFIVKPLDDKIEQAVFAGGERGPSAKSLREHKAKLQKAREDYSTYVYFMRCVHPNGIPYDVTKKMLPIINEEVEKVLADVVDFQVFFEEDGNKLNIFIKHPKFVQRPIELGSGAEKTIAATAVSVANKVGKALLNPG